MKNNLASFRLNRTVLTSLFRSVKEQGQTLVLIHFRKIERIVAVIGLLLIMGIIIYFVFVDPGASSSSLSTMPAFNTDSLDQLEVWIEERHTTMVEGLRIPSEIW